MNNTNLFCEVLGKNVKTSTTDVWQMNINGFIFSEQKM